MDRDVWSHLQKYVKADVLSVSFSQLTVSSGNTMVTGTSYQLSDAGKAINDPQNYYRSGTVNSKFHLIRSFC